MKKQAALSPKAITLLKTLLGVGIGGTTGATAGYEVTPRVGGYADVEAARRASALMHGLTGGVAGGMIGRFGPAGALKKIPGKAWLGLGPGLIAEEYLPMGQASMHRYTDALQQQAQATQQAATATGTTSVPEAIKSFVTSPTGKGVGAGAALAGLAAIISGLTRRQSDEEFKRRKSRYGMISSDALKLMLPMMVAGGLGGSLLGRKQ